MKNILFILSLVLVIIGCSSSPWLGEDDEERLEGERISLTQATKEIQPAVSLQGEEVILPPPVENAFWALAGGNAANNSGHVALGTDLKEMWTGDIGSSNGSGQFNFARPISAIGAIFTLDPDLTISGFRLKDGKRVWQTSVMPDDEASPIVNGGLAYGEKRVFAATAFGHVFALHPANGEVLWYQKIGSPVYAAPIVYGKRLFVSTIDNQVYALNAQTGKILWSYEGLNEITGVLGGSGLAASNGIVVAPFSNGEIVALKADNGRVLWVDSLATRAQLRDRLSTIPDIRARPVIDEDQVYIVSHGNRLGVFGLENGQRIWGRELGGTRTPAIAGDYLFLIDNQQRLYCVTKRDGLVAWVSDLPTYEDMEDKDDPVYWTGPLVAGEQLIVFGSHGKIMAVSPYNGQVQRTYDVGGNILIPPAIVQQHLLVVNDDGNLLALK